MSGLGEQQNSSLIFLADCMIGRLAIWLRMLSNPTTYFPSIADNEILHILKDNEILLTRDVELHKRAKSQGFVSFLITASDTRSQFLEVLKAYPITINPFQPYCIQCSGLLKLMILQELKSPLPVTDYQDFWECTNCYKIYWRGLKWKGFIEPLIGEILPIKYVQHLENTLFQLREFSERRWFVWALDAIRERKKKDCFRNI